MGEPEPRQSLWRRLRAHPWRVAGLTAGIACVLLNAWAFRHVWVMTHFSPGGVPTVRPEELSLAGKVGVLLTGINVPRPTSDRTPADIGLEFRTERLTAADGCGLEAWVVTAPAPRAVVVLFHGYHSSKSGLLAEAQYFHDLDCSVVLTDFRGSGGSDGDVTTLGYRESLDVQRAGELAERIAPGVPRVLFGRSMGSVAILRAVALAQISPDGIVIECPFDRLITTVRHRFTAMSLPSFPAADLMICWGSIQHGINGFAHNPLDYATLVRCPTLQLHGERDLRVSVEEARRVFDLLAGEKQFEVFRGAGHESCFRSQPELWKQHVSAFLERLAP